MVLPPVEEKIRDLCGTGTTSMTEVIERLVVICQKPINLVEHDGEWGSLTALKVEFEDHINVLFPPQNSLQYKLHCIYHELGHIYLEKLDLALPEIPQSLLNQTADAISVSCRHIEDDPVERWVENFAFMMSKKTRARSRSALDPFLC
ncbi:hypothetical protein [Arthrobacter antibioticus]|uniref:hypothetical protein n=1 Tax=Arthrobacter sp. H35-MC1 TaxID=3046203 RepID=UPI0024BAA5B7|nr:hypothetical protein [Arthrobacter sp. H35-MC1]MDJ0318617.1 hypothetical protein [Arthrobacter sp. H35-MC1]